MAPRGVSTWRRPYTSIYNENYRYGTGLYSDTLTDIEKRYSDSISKTQLRSDRPDLTFSTFSGSNLTSSAAPADKDDTYTYTYTSTRQQQPLSPSPMPEIVRSPTFETRLNATLKSAASALDEDVDEVIRTRIEQRKAAIARSVEAEKAEADEDDDFRRRLEIRKKALERAKTATEIKSSKSTADSDQYVVSKSSSTKKVTTSSEETKVKPTSLYDDASLWTLPKDKPALDLDLDTSKSRRKAGGRQTPTNGPTSSRWKDKSRELQDQVVSLEKSMSDGSTRLRSELTSLKSKYNTELYDLSGSVENTTQQATDLQRLCKRQATQLQELQSAYDSAQRNIQDVLEEMNVWQNKCKSLKKEMDRLREDVEMAVNKRSKA